MNNSVEISLNGELISIEATLNFEQALESWGYGEKKVAAAINGEFVPRSCYDSKHLSAGDEIDVVAPVGGG